MGRLRILLDRFPAIFVTLLACALAAKVAVPTGYMLSSSGGTMVVEVCTGSGPQKMTIAVPGLGDPAGEHGGNRSDSAAGDMPCAFASLAFPALGGVDPVLLVVALAVVATLALHAAAPFAVFDVKRARPPSRAPPVSV